jgi:hypothetical protein
MFISSKNTNDYILHQPGIEPGAKPWKGSMLPLHH